MAKYKQLYANLGPEGGKIPGSKAKSVLIDSKLPVDILGKIWDLADADKDGSLSEMEFIIAMHLVYKAIEKYPLPSLLPQELQKLIQQPSPIPSLPRKPSITSEAPQQLVSAPLIPQHPVKAPSPVPIIPTATLPVKDNWIVPYDERAKFKALFHSTDLDHDGFVSGTEIKGNKLL